VGEKLSQTLWFAFCLVGASVLVDNYGLRLESPNRLRATSRQSGAAGGYTPSRYKWATDRELNMATTIEAVATPKPDAVAAPRRLDYLPIALFGSTMGLIGLSVAWTLAHNFFGTPLWVSGVIGSVSVAVFVALFVGYSVKTICAPDKVLAEFRHPIAGNLFGTFLISILLLPIVIAPVSIMAARILWWAGTGGMVLFAWTIVSRWMSDRQQTAHATPAWIVPVVGMLDVPLALPVLGLPPLPEVTILSVAVGLFFAVPLFTLIFSRLVFEAPMPDALQPTLLILVAPFSVGFSSYIIAVGRVDLFAESLYFLMLFVLAVLLGRLRMLRQCCPFRVSWWAVSFPLASSAVAALRFAAFDPNWFTKTVAAVLLALATVAIAGLLVRTLAGVVQGELRTLSS
jgi:tellurite resistance protein